MTPSEVALTVGRLQYKAPSGEPRLGFCSAWLTGLQPGDRVRYKLVSQVCRGGGVPLQRGLHVARLHSLCLVAR